MQKKEERKYQAEFGPEDYYRYYRKVHKLKRKQGKFVQTSSQRLLTYAEFSDILNDYFLAVREELFKNNIYQFPMHFGTLQIRKKKKLIINPYTNKINLPIDWENSKKLHKVIYLTNDHREGHVYKFVWHRGKKLGIHWYTFRPCRLMKRALAKILKEDKTVDFGLQGKISRRYYKTYNNVST